MKKSYFHSAAWAFLLIASLSAYFYLRNIPTEDYQAYTSTEKNLSTEQADLEEDEVLLPEIALVKKVIDLSKLVFESK